MERKTAIDWDDGCFGYSLFDSAKAEDIGFRHEADAIADDFAVFEIIKGRNREDVVFCRDFLNFVHVDAEDFDFGVLFSDLADDRAQHFAGAAPCGVEVDKDARGFDFG